MIRRDSPQVPLVICFIVLTVSILSAGLLFPDSGIDYLVLVMANCLFFFMSLVVFNMQRKAMAHPNPNVFVRSVMIGVMIKMGVCLAAVVGYVLLTRPDFNKPAIYISLVIYAVYLVAEVSIVMKLNKSKNA